MAFYIDKKDCLGCGACAFACLYNIPKPNEDKTCYEIDSGKCIGCGQCENICPNSAIKPMPAHRRIKKVTIDKEKCIGCSLCARKCFANAPHGKIKEPFEIDRDKCFRCGACAAACRKDAIVVEYE